MSEELVQEAVGAAVDEVPEDQVGVRVTGTVSRPKGGDATQVLLYGGKGARRCLHEIDAPTAAATCDRRPGRDDVCLLVTGGVAAVAGRARCRP